MIDVFLDSAHILIESFKPRTENEYIAIFNLASFAGLNTEDIDTRQMSLQTMKMLQYEGYDSLTFDVQDREKAILSCEDFL
jgi:hypothetical protein